MEIYYFSSNFRLEDLQPVAEKMRHEMLVETQIEMLDGQSSILLFK